MDNSASNPYTGSKHHQITNSHDSAASTSEHHTHSMIRPGMFSHGLPAPPHQPPGNLNVSHFPHHYGASSVSPSTASGTTKDHEAAFAGAGISPTHLSAQLSAQKRAYRQRRKDPSCDACRERKVKCDATETSSCSECHQRAVKCQFTKETNRRMSSIKQVQDLQTQLDSARNTINDLTSRLNKGPASDSTGRPFASGLLDLPGLEEETGRIARNRATAPPNFAHVQRNARIWGHGIYRPPAQHRQSTPNPTFYPHQKHLPPKQTTDRLIGQFYRSVHAFAPAIDFVDFCRELDTAYGLGTLSRSPHTWIALFYAVLGCGSLRKIDGSPRSPQSDQEGKHFIDDAAKAFSLWTDDFTLDHARIALLISIYHLETGLRSASSLWLGNAVRVAVDLGLHQDCNPATSMLGDVSQRLWWSIYTWDRLLCLEIGRPLLISDDECEIRWPKEIRDQNMIQSLVPDITVIPSEVNFWNQAMLTRVARLIGQLRRTINERTTTLTTLQAYDDYFHAVLAAMPEPFHVHTTVALDPSSLFSALTLQNARLQLYRLNITSIMQGPERSEALNRCVNTSSDTARYISRSQKQSQGSPDSRRVNDPYPHGWATALASSAPSMLCTHLWRSTLFLCFSGHFADALMCVRASAAIGELYHVNTACGRNLTFFLKCLSERIDAGRGSREFLNHDEEMLAYVVGDMQGNAETAWVWSGQESSQKMAPPAADSPLDQMHTQAGRSPALLSDTQIREWRGWRHVEMEIQRLLDQNNASTGRPPSQHLTQPATLSPPHHQPPPPPLNVYKPPHNMNKRLQLDPGAAPPVMTPHSASIHQPSPVSSTASPGTASRISIANII